MASEIVFNMSDKALLVKLHQVALKLADKVNRNKLQIANSGLSDGKSINLNIKDFSKIETLANDKIKYFSNKSGLYELGVIFDVDAIKKYIKSFSTVKNLPEDKLPKELYEENIQRKYENDAEKMKNDAYDIIVSYMTAFCGEKYAQSISEKQLICEAYDNVDSTLQVKDGILGKSDFKIHQISTVLYKIGYSVGIK